MAATKTYKGNCGRCGDQQVVQMQCACICGTCEAYQDARPEQDTQIQEAVEVQEVIAATHEQWHIVKMIKARNRGYILPVRWRYILYNEMVLAYIIL
jgi:hypothetical protein